MSRKQYRKPEALERHKEQVRRNNRARHAASVKLIALYQEEFDELYRREAEKVGIKVIGRRQPKPSNG